MLPALVVLLIAFSASAAGTVRFRAVASSLGFVDQPDERKTHERPIPLLGGLAIVGGIVLAVLLASVALYGRVPRTVAGILFASMVVALAGLLDDHSPLPAWAKLGAQFAAVLILLGFGIGVQLPLPSPINYAITLFWVIGISNAVNFLDNMDGLSAGISAVASAFILLLAIVNEQVLVAALSAALLGACLGFLRYNFPPASIYMGDAGSLFLGFLLAVLAMQLRFPENSNYVTWMVPLFILGLPLFDMTLVVYSRLRRGESPNTPGHDHVSHRLVKQGFSVRETDLLLYLVGGILGLVAVFVTQASVVEGYLMGVIAILLALIAIWQFEATYGP
jgi:UDP-GlcNAc:undecaprenyl-phosphate GlcNAc-1-phosphate transferase